MLTRYKKSHEKIAMGFLSFMPKEKNIKQLMTTIKSYEIDESQRLFLWKEEDDFIGIIGVHLLGDNRCEVQHVCVSPSHRNQGIGHKMMEHLQELYSSCDIYGNEDVTDFYEKCTKQYVKQ